MYYDGLPTVKEHFVNELNDSDMWKYLFVLLYADDTIILAESEDQLQKSLNGLHDYCKKWYLKVNIKKTKIMVFSRGVIRKKPKLVYDNCMLEVCNEFVYLGVKFFCTGSFKCAIQSLSQQANNAMFSLLAKARKLSLSMDTIIHLFDSTVLPILLYGCEVWGHLDYKAANTLYLRFFKILLGLKKSTNSCMVLGELGRLPLSYIINKRMINFWAKLVHDDKNKISAMVLRCISSMKTSSNWQSPWLCHIHKLLDHAGLSYIWHSPKTVPVNYLQKVYSLRSADIAKQKWKNDVSESSRCSIYKLSEKDLIFEEYLTNLPWPVAKQLCRLRTSNHRLPIEMGRYINIPRTNRFCLLCNDKVIGDEYHYVMICTHFSDIRENYVNIDPQISKQTVFKQLLLTHDRNKLTKLSNFMKKIYQQF